MEDEQDKTKEKEACSKEADKPSTKIIEKGKGSQQKKGTKRKIDAPTIEEVSNA